MKVLYICIRYIEAVIDARRRLEEESNKIVDKYNTYKRQTRERGKMIAVSR